MIQEEPSQHEFLARSSSSYVSLEQPESLLNHTFELDEGSNWIKKKSKNDLLRVFSLQQLLRKEIDRLTEVNIAKKTLAEDFISLFSEFTAVPLNEKEQI